MALATCALLASAAVASTAAAAPKQLSGFVGGGVGINTAGTFTFPSDVAVYTGGSLDPADSKIFTVEGLGSAGSSSQTHRVQRLDADGNPELVWGRDTVAPGAPGDTGSGYEVCDVAVSGAENCTRGLLGSGDGEFDDPTGIAVNQGTGHVYVRDRDNNRVQQFDLDGQFIRSWGTAGAGNGQFANTGLMGVGIAVAPGTGDVYVADPGNRRIQRFTADGVFIDAIGTPVAGDPAPPGEFGPGQPLHVSVDGDGIVYASDSVENGRVQRYDSQSDSFLDPIGADGSPGGLLAAGTTRGLAIDPGAGTLLVLREPSSGTTVVQELEIPSPATGPVVTVVENHPVVDRAGAVVLGFGLDETTGALILAVPGLILPPHGIFEYGGPCTPTASGQSCAGLFALADSGSPSVSAVGSSDVDARSASVVGTVDPAGGFSRVRFEVSADGVNWDRFPVGYRAVAGARQVSATVSGLQPATLYRLRLVLTRQSAIDEFVTVSSSESTFLTDAAPPDVQTLGSAGRTDTTAQLRARVDPNGSDTDYRFEYGLAGGSYDFRVPVPDAPAGAGNSPKLLVQGAAGLAPDTEYQFRIVATNFVGTAVGDPVVFRTREAVGPAPPPPGRAYELVSPAYKVGGIGLGQWYHDEHDAQNVGFPALDAERTMLQATQGSMLLGDAGFAFANDAALAERGPGGWVSHSPFTRGGYGDQQARFARVGAISARDLSLTAWHGGGDMLRLFPEQEPWRPPTGSDMSFVSDWVGRWEPLAPIDPAGPDSGLDPSDDPFYTGLRLDPVKVADEAPLVVGRLAGRVLASDLSGGVSDTFPGTGARSWVDACSGSGPARTELPEGDVDGFLVPAACSAGDDVPVAAAGSTIRFGNMLLGSSTRNLVSRHGSRVFFMAGTVGAASCAGIGAATTCPLQLFVRDKPLGGGDPVVRWISRPEVVGQRLSLVGPAIFEGASADGNKVFFRTTSPLTEDDANGGGSVVPGGVTSGQANPSSWDLYMYEFPDGLGADPGDGALTRISAGPNGDGDCNSPLGGGSTTEASASLRFVSDDGTRAYFTCAAPLPGVGLPSNGTITDPGGASTTAEAVNLYMYDANEPSASERWRFVARLPRATVGTSVASCATSAPEQGDSVGQRMSCVRGTADGTFITFWTPGRLTLDDPDDSSADIYGYDATRDELTRLSRPQGGVGGTYPCPAPSTEDCYGDPGLAEAGSAVGGALGLVTEPDDAGARTAFFSSRSRLVPEDVDDAHDVYQWRDGELSLISTGDTGAHGDGAFYVGNDRTGRNVYFATLDRLSWQDTDSVLDLYTARVGNGIPQPPPPPVCVLALDACRAPGRAVPPPPRIESATPGGSNAAPKARPRLRVARPPASARRRAAARGVLRLAVRTSAPGRVRAVARARVGRRVVPAGRVVQRVARSGRTVLALRLAPRVRRALRAGRRIRVSVRVTQPGAAPRSLTVVLIGRSR